MPKDPILFNPQGGRLQQQEMAEAASFQVRSDYSMKTGLGHVVFDIPGGTKLKLLPQEAMTLGMRFITEAESAIGQAITLRILMVICEMNPEEAVHALQHVGRDVRENHAMLYEWAINEKMERAKKAQGLMQQPTSSKPQ